MNRRHFLQGSIALAGQKPFLSLHGPFSIAAADHPTPAATSPQNLLASTFTESFLSSHLLPVDQYHPYPRWDERSALGGRSWKIFARPLFRQPAACGRSQTAHRRDHSPVRAVSIFTSISYWPDAGERRKAQATSARRPCATLRPSACSTLPPATPLTFLPILSSTIWRATSSTPTLLTIKNYIDYGDAHVHAGPEGDLLYRYGKAVPRRRTSGVRRVLRRSQKHARQSWRRPPARCQSAKHVARFAAAA